MKFEVGKYYRSSGGERYKVVAIWSEPCSAGYQMTALNSGGIPQTFTITGKFFSKEHSSDSHFFDLICEWEPRKRVKTLRELLDSGWELDEAGYELTHPSSTYVFALCPSIQSKPMSAYCGKELDEAAKEAWSWSEEMLVEVEE